MAPGQTCQHFQITQSFSHYELKKQITVQHHINVKLHILKFIVHPLPLCHHGTDWFPIIVGKWRTAKNQTGKRSLSTIQIGLTLLHIKIMTMLCAELPTPVSLFGTCGRLSVNPLVCFYIYSPLLDTSLIFTKFFREFSKFREVFEYDFKMIRISRKS